MRNSLRRSLAGSVSLLLLTSCATFHEASQTHQAAMAGIDASGIPTPPVVQTVDTPFLLGTAVNVVPPESPLLKQRVTLVSSQKQSVFEIAGQISQMTGIPVDVTELSAGGGDTAAPALAGSVGGLPPPPSAFLASMSSVGANSASDVPEVAVHYSGSLSGLLDTVGSAAGLSWRFEDGGITLFRVETKTFSIPALAWTTSGQTQIAANVGAASSGSTAGGGSSGNTQSVGATTITTSSTADVWSDLIATAKTMGGGAVVTASKSTGTITVTGTPDQIQQVSNWVQSIVPILSRQVALTVQVYAVHLNKEQNYGFTPTIAFENEAKTIGATLTGAPAPTVTGSTQPMSFGASILSTATGALGQWSGSQIAVQALATMGSVDQVFSRDLVTLNGQEAPIQVAQQIGYLQSSSTTATTNAGTTSTLTPGTVTAGFTGSITPRVVGGKIFLGMNITISSLDALQTITSGGSSIQVPTTDDSVIQQSAALQSGSTLMITGFQQDQGKTTHNGVGSPFLPIFGGGADASVNKILIAIVVTARTL